MSAVLAAPKVGRIRSALRSWLGIPIGMTSDTDEQFWRQFGGRSSAAGVVVNEDNMLQVSAVWACARLISETISTLPLNLYERTPAGPRVAVRHPLQTVIHDMPNPQTTSSLHWEATVAAMTLRGNARAEILRIGDETVGLRFLDPNRLQPHWDYGNTREWVYTARDGTSRTIPNSRMWTVPGFSLNGMDGLSVVRYGAQVMGAAIAANNAAASTFANGLSSSFYFKVDRPLSPEQRELFHTQRAPELTGMLHGGRPPLLEKDWSIDTIGLSPDDAQLLQSRSFGVDEVCHWFRVPPFMVGHSEKSTSWGTGIEQQMIGFLTFTLAPWLRRIEQAIWKDLLTEAERPRYYAKFSVEGLLRADSAARAAFYSQMVNNGILTRDEVRELEERQPMGGNAGVLTVQSAMVPLDDIQGAAATTDANAARASLRNWLGLGDNPAALGDPTQ